MKRTALLLSLAGCLLPVMSSHAVDLKQSKVTQVVNDVRIISAADQSAKPAVVNDVFKIPDIIRTGPGARAELVAEDQTITRIGANTIFSFDPASRTVNLKQGSLLFHSPKGKGGGTIQTGSATASVLGTTIVVTTTPDGGFKFLVLEGEGEASFLGGLKQQLKAGQMTFILPDGGISPIIVFRLDENTQGSLLVNGFDKPLPSWDKINDEIQRQLKLINKGKVIDTGLNVGEKANESQVEAFDPSALQDYFSNLTKFQPIFTGIGYFTIDGMFVTVDDPLEPISHAQFPAWALSLNVDMSSALLNPYHVFQDIGPFVVITPAFPEQNPFFKNPFSGFFARNFGINTPTIDMTPYQARETFDFLAAQDINFNQSVTLEGALENQSIYFTAGGKFNFAPGSTLTANAAALYMGSIGDMNFTDANFVNNIGGIALTTFGSMTLNGGTFNAGSYAVFSANGPINITDTTINSGSALISIGLGGLSPITLNNATLHSGSGVNFNTYGDVSITGGSILSDDGNVALFAQEGSMTLNGGSITAGNLTLLPPLPPTPPTPVVLVEIDRGSTREIIQQPNPRNINIYGKNGVSVTGTAMAASSIMLNSGDGILLNNVTMSGNTLTLNAPNTIHVGSADHVQDLTGLASVNMIAHTINLLNVAFGGSSYVNLFSANGQLAPNPNTGASSLPGYVNFINGVTYGGNPAQNYVNPEGGAGIYIYSTP